MYEKNLFKQLLKQRLRFLYLMSLALLCNINLLSAEPDIIIESDQQPKILSEVLEELGNIYNVFFSYNSQQLNEVEVHFDFTPNEKIDDAINRLLEDSNYGYEAFGGKYYVVFAKTVKGKKNAKKIIEKIQEIQEIENEGDASIQLVRKNPARHLSSVSTSVSAIIMEEVIKGFVNGPDGEQSGEYYSFCEKT